MLEKKIRRYKLMDAHRELVRKGLYRQAQLELKEKKHGALYWICVGWWLKPILWLFLTLPMLVVSIFKPKKYKTVNHTKKIAVCNNCGKSWKV